MTPGEAIDVDDLRDVGPARDQAGGGRRGAATAPGTLREFKESAERAFLVGKLRENGWNISKTAEVIGTPRSNLYKKLEQYGISQENDGWITADAGQWQSSSPPQQARRSPVAP